MNKRVGCSKTRVLFVIPTLAIGGTVSSLLSLLRSDVTNFIAPSVFSITNSGEYKEYLKDYNLFSYLLLALWFGNYAEMSFPYRLLAFPLKMIKKNKRIANWVEDIIIACAHKEIEKRNFDVVVAFAERQATYFVSTMNHKKKISWIHCDYARINDNAKDATIYDKFHQIVCVSQFTKESFCQIFPQLRDRTLAIHNIFNYRHILNSSKDGIDDSRFVKAEKTILSVGRISEPKRFHLIPRIAASLASKGLNFKWYILGPDREKKYVDMLIDEIEKYKMQDHVICLGNKLNPYPYFKESDVLVSTSFSEACPMVFNEAKLLCLPIVSTDFGSAREFLQGEENCWISTVDNIDKAIYHVLSLPRIERDFGFSGAEKRNQIIVEQLRTLFS